MKKIVQLFMAVMLISISACSTSDDETSNLIVTGSLDVAALLTLQDNDATSLVSLNGEAAASYTSEVLVGEEIFYTIDTSSDAVEVVIIDFFYVSGDREFWDSGVESSVDVESSVATLKVINGSVDDEAKFGFTFALKTNGIIDLNTTYIVDPKIRVRS
ncbi:hypothetical protein [Polaribacter sp. Asnod6-C07]|uniref:hypothetical protein n=1 Tax=Polaribacter sp. Asnod6-C07 TaxID=3160582 RepID=UPI003869B2E6